MLSLCRLSAPVTIRAPVSAQLRRFRFFTSRSRHPDGSERLQLHMGYFASLAEAEKWAQALRSRYPEVAAVRVPAQLLQQRNSGVPVLRGQSSVPQPPSTPAAHSPLDAETLTDTQVLRVLEARQPTAGQAVKKDPVGGISLLAPDDTHKRRALKQAVAQGAPVSFAVQLLCSEAHINLANVPALSVFRAYTLYKVTATREGRSLHCLRAGFFSDAISAKQLAYYVKAHFPAVAVLPVTEPELSQATETAIDPSRLSNSFQRSIDERLEADKAETTAPRPSFAVTTPAQPKAATGSLEQTLEMLATTELWDTPDTHSETGVRHLKFEVQKD